MKLPALIFYNRLNGGMFVLFLRRKEPKDAHFPRLYAPAAFKLCRFMEAPQPVPFATGCAARTRQMPTPRCRHQHYGRSPAVGKCMKNHIGMMRRPIHAHHHTPRYASVPAALRAPDKCPSLAGGSDAMIYYPQCTCARNPSPGYRG